MNLSSLISQEESLQRHGLIVERLTDGTLRANVQHIKCHSPTGYECGYAGSGPADLALSVLAALIPAISEEEEQAQEELTGEDWDRAMADPTRWPTNVGPERTRVSYLAYRLHQQFKEDFIVRMPKEGGFIAIADIQAWIDAKKAEIAARVAAGVGAE